MFEFELNNVRIPKIRDVGSSGTGTTWIGAGTTWIGTGTIHVLVSGTSTTLDGTGTILPLHKWYRYHPYLVSIPVAGTD